MRYENPDPEAEGQNWLLQSLNDYLAAIRFRIDAATEAAAVLARYNADLVRLEEIQGTLLASSNMIWPTTRASSCGGTASPPRRRRKPCPLPRTRRRPPSLRGQAASCLRPNQACRRPLHNPRPCPRTERLRARSDSRPGRNSGALPKFRPLAKTLPPIAAFGSPLRRPSSPEFAGSRSLTYASSNGGRNNFPVLEPSRRGRSAGRGR